MDARRGAALTVAALVAAPATMLSQERTEWPVHAMDRPRPPVVEPGRAPPPAPTPSDAIVLFDGRDLAEWQGPEGRPAGWRLVDGAMEVVRGSGSIQTRREFGDIQLHVEWMTPVASRGDGQGAGNSGVFLMGMYEIQVLNSYRNDTYPDGQAAALYGQTPPAVNASRPPGEWQTYDIVFRRPRFAADGAVREPARVTVFHNGVLVHDNVAFTGQTVHARRARYEPHGDLGPLMLQDHGDPVRFRNVWVREIE